MSNKASSVINEEKQKLSEKLNSIQRIFKTKENNYQHQLRKLKLENEQLQKQATNTIGMKL